MCGLCELAEQDDNWNVAGLIAKAKKMELRLDQTSRNSGKKTLGLRIRSSHVRRVRQWDVCWFQDFVAQGRIDYRLECVSQLFEETEHFCRWHQKQVAKSVPYALPPFRSLDKITSGLSGSRPFGLRAKV